MNRSYYRLGLTGYPVQHSLSPVLHTAALAAANLAGDYKVYAIPPTPEGSDQLAALVNEIRCGTLHGLNVTMPHKQAVIPYLDGLTSAARIIGAVNTIWCQDGLIMGGNTDAPGFFSDLARVFPELAHSKQKLRALVLGAGGAGRAVIYALLERGWEVDLCSRRQEQAVSLAADLQCSAYKEGKIMSGLNVLPAVSAQVLREKAFDLIINATPVGMHPEPFATPWNEINELPTDCMVYDLIYWPLETTFVRQAKIKGHRAVNGLGMLVEQAALAFEQWTGFPASRERMWQDVLAALDQA